MKEVGIYRKAFPRISETFIEEQAKNLNQYLPTFITCKLINSISYRYAALSEGDLLHFKQAIHLLTTSPHPFMWGNSFEKLNLIHAHFGPDGVYAMKITDYLKIPLIVTFHGHDATVSRSAMLRSGNLAYYQFMLHEEKLKRKASIFIAVSGYIERKLINSGYPKEKIIKHHIGIDVRKFYPAESKAAERYILCVGRHTPKKGIDTLLRAFAQIAKHYPDVCLIQVGTGSMTAELNFLANQLGIEKQVKFLGAQPHHIVQQLVREAEIFSLPSQTAKDGNSEGLPFVLLEASACAIPIVSTWHSGIPEAVIDKETGFLVPERSDVMLAEKLSLLLSQPSLAKSMGHQGRNFIIEHFNIVNQTAKLEGIYNSLL